MAKQQPQAPATSGSPDARPEVGVTDPPALGAPADQAGPALAQPPEPREPERTEAERDPRDPPPKRPPIPAPDWPKAKLRDGLVRVRALRTVICNALSYEAGTVLAMPKAQAERQKRLGTVKIL